MNSFVALFIYFLFFKSRAKYSRSKCSQSLVCVSRFGFLQQVFSSAVELENFCLKCKLLDIKFFIVLLYKNWRSYWCWSNYNVQESNATVSLTRESADSDNSVLSFNIMNV